jgi:hypothetical protein
VYGGAEVGAYCARHARVSCIHLTGSDATYNNIVFGAPKVQVRVQLGARVRRSSVCVCRCPPRPRAHVPASCASRNLPSVRRMCAHAHARTCPQPGAVPVLDKPVTAELGNVTPYIIVPGEWSQADLEFHATNVASGLAQNTGHNCIAAEVCVCVCVCVCVLAHCDCVRQRDELGDNSASLARHTAVARSRPANAPHAPGAHHGRVVAAAARVPGRAVALP